MLTDVKNIKKNYGKKTVLEDISFRADSGECVGIVGENGCGKSTLLSILSGCLKADGGTIFYDGINPFKQPAYFAKNVGYVPQENPIMEGLSVLDNLRFWYCDSGYNLEHDLENGVPQMLGVTQVLYQRADKLSGGQKKRLSIACALAGRPKILILDEPGASLDIVCKNDIVDFLGKYKSTGNTVILASHEEAELSVCDRMYLMKNGKLGNLGKIAPHNIIDFIRS